MAEGNGRAYDLILAAIIAGFAAFAFSMAILIGMGFGLVAAIPIAYTMSSFAFGAFLCRLYRAIPKEPNGAITPSHVGELEENRVQKCLILAARTHGALQDRANYWLSGKYGTVKTSAVSATDKGIFMTIFYETIASSEAPAVEDQSTTRELPAIENVAPRET